MHTITAGRLEAAQHALSAMSSRVWELEHPETRCLLRAEFNAGLLTVEVVNGPPWLDTTKWWDDDANDDAISEALDSLAKAGLLRTFAASPEAALRELRLLADTADIREIAP